MEITHLTWATIGRQSAFPTEAARRRVLRALATAVGDVLVLFALVDDHVHLVVRVEEARLRRVQGAVTRVLNSRSDAEFAAPYARPVTTRKHMTTLIGYCLGQFEHHGLADDPATATGSCFPDLVGARRLPGLTLQLDAALPRVRLRAVYAAVGLDTALKPAADEDLRALGPARFAELVAQTFSIAPGFAGQTEDVVAARGAAAHLAAQVGLRPRDVAAALGVSPSAANRLAKKPADAGDLRAVRLRAALEAAALQRRLPSAANGRN